MERLDKFLCDCGAGTRSQVKVIVKAGRVAVNGIACKDSSCKIDPRKDTVTLDGRQILPGFLQENSHLLLSGILDTRLDDVRRAIEDAGLTIVEQKAKEDWRSLKVRKCL